MTSSRSVTMEMDVFNARSLVLTRDGSSGGGSALRWRPSPAQASPCSAGRGADYTLVSHPRSRLAGLPERCTGRARRSFITRLTNKLVTEYQRVRNTKKCE
ncbi:hypothetical protein E2C01_079464 [Portunus trituberculatus]|uniref:Uncharacterized protein n=1 Tax=Portunus trituberculatus TaxID=210409 RepID=A0A5B7ITF3_PORTR|nr:hypothetical protein [Portunus trituberculatus]